MQQKQIELNIVISSVRSKVDRSLSITLSTPELYPNEMAEIMNLQGVNLISLFTPLDEKDAPKYIVNRDIETKTPSNRLRNTLYVLWEQEGGKGEFDEFYKRYMEKFIDLVKDKLQ